MTTTTSTLLSAIQALQKDALSPDVNHLFAASAEKSCSTLQDIIHTAQQVSESLNTYIGTPLTSPKVVSLLRQHSTQAHLLHSADNTVKHAIQTLRTRTGVNYGEQIPLDRKLVPEWTIARFESWSKVVGMETFRDEEGREGSVNLILGGGVLVVDVNFSIDKSNPEIPVLSIASVKTSYAIPNPVSGSSNTDGSISLDGFLTDTMRLFCVEVQKPHKLHEPLEAARLASVIRGHLSYLVILDKLAQRKDDGGIRWFVDVDKLCTTLETFASSEAVAVASSLSKPRAPLDVFLHRSHSLPLPYLAFPTISFLIYLSPQVYLTLLKNSLPPLADGPAHLAKIDVPFSDLRTFLATPHQGATMATLRLSPPTDVHLFPASMSMPTLTTRPTFSVVPDGSELEHVFPMTDGSLAENVTNGTTDQHAWILDFTSNGTLPGVVMSHSRMRDIELVVNPLSSMDDMHTISPMSFRAASWIDLLLNPGSQVSPERYTALYQSPTNSHPPLQLRLTSPEEPGFLLQKVPVHSMKEVWGILEVVREQCWLNEILLGCHWTTEGIIRDADKLPQDDVATEADLEAILSGTLKPRKIPVNVYLPKPDITAAPMFNSTELRPRVIMTAPERHPMSGLVGITVTYDETQPWGVSVQVSGAIGASFQPGVLEEICRRGGTFGLPGRIWSKADVSM